MQAHEIQPGDTVEITLTVKVSKVEHHDHAGHGEVGPGFTAIEFDEFEIPPAPYSGRTTSAFTLELADGSDYTIEPA
jgi:hypothetical protein